MTDVQESGIDSKRIYYFNRKSSSRVNVKCKQEYCKHILNAFQFVMEIIFGS